MAQIIGSRKTTPIYDTKKSTTPSYSGVSYYGTIPYGSNNITYGGGTIPYSAPSITPSTVTSGGIGSANTDPVTQALVQATTETGGGGGGTSLPAYDFPTYNINLPDLSWNPTEQQRGGWLEEAIKRAGLVIDPQAQEREQALQRFMTAAQNQRAEINPRYDALSLAVANMYKNVVDDALVKQAIRRGAEQSGWLPSELAKAGKQQIAERRDIGNERNRLLDAIANQVLGKEQETTDALQMLEEMRGKQTDVNYADLERLARSDFLQEKQGTFENELQNAIFQSGYGMDQANYLLNRFNTEKQAQLAEAQLGLDERSTALQEALANYQMKPQASYSSVPIDAYEQARIANLNAQTQQILNSLNSNNTTDPMAWLLKYLGE